MLIEIRSARPSDAEGCAEILNAWIDATDWMPRCHSRESVAAHFRDDVIAQRKVWIAEEGARMAGFLALDPVGLVTDFYLAEACRGKGLGRRLLNLAKQSSAHGLSLWTFQANHGARTFYSREGFVETRQTDGDNEEGLPDVFLEWHPAATDHTRLAAEGLDNEVLR
ncbi:MAG: GNAT family N-acetyltransferase [Pseudomonadota bacterium]